MDEPSDLAGIVEPALPTAEVTGPEEPPDDTHFVVTKEHRRYASWQELEPLLRTATRHFTEGRDHTNWHTLPYTPTVSATPRMTKN